MVCLCVGQLGFPFFAVIRKYPTSLGFKFVPLYDPVNMYICISILFIFSFGEHSLSAPQLNKHKNGDAEHPRWIDTYADEKCVYSCGITIWFTPARWYGVLLLLWFQPQYEKYATSICRLDRRFNAYNGTVDFLCGVAVGAKVYRIYRRLLQQGRKQANKNILEN